MTKASSDIAYSLSETTINLGSELQVSGSINPAVSDKTVTLTYRKPNGSTVMRTVMTGLDGSYSNSYTPDADGS